MQSNCHVNSTARYGSSSKQKSHDETCRLKSQDCACANRLTVILEVCKHQRIHAQFLTIILLLGMTLMMQSQDSYSQGFFTQHMFAMVQHEEGGILVGGVYIGHIHDVHLAILGQLHITSPRPLHPCQRIGLKLLQMIAKRKTARTAQG